MMVYQVEFKVDTPDLYGFKDSALQDIRATAVIDPELIEVQALFESGWPAQLVRPYWPVCDEHKVHNGLLFKQDRPFLPPPPYSRQAPCGPLWA